MCYCCVELWIGKIGANAIIKPPVPYRVVLSYSILPNILENQSLLRNPFWLVLVNVPVIPKESERIRPYMRFVYATPPTNLPPRTAISFETYLWNILTSVKQANGQRLYCIC